MPEDVAPDDGRKPFAAFLQEQRRGALHGELSEGLAELVRACHEARGKGTLTLQIIVVPNADGVTVTVADKVKIVPPEHDRGAAIFFYDADGNVSRKNPAQTELPLREATEGRQAG